MCLRYKEQRRRDFETSPVRVFILRYLGSSCRFLCLVKGEEECRWSSFWYVQREHLLTEYSTLHSSTNRIFVRPKRLQSNPRAEHSKVQSGVPRSIMKINTNIPAMFRTTEKPIPAPWLVSPRRRRILFDCSVLSPPEDSKSLKYL